MGNTAKGMGCSGEDQLSQSRTSLGNSTSAGPELGVDETATTMVLKIVQLIEGSDVCCVEVASKASVRDVKSAIQAKTRMDPSWQNLLVDDERLRDEALLEEYGVEDGSSLSLLVTAPQGFYKLAEEHSPISARFMRSLWDPHDKRHEGWAFCSEPTDMGMHAQFIAAGRSVLETDSMKANALSERAKTLEHATGWAKPPTELKYGRGGLIGPWLDSMEIEFDFGAQVPIIGIQTDSPFPFTVLSSNDGETWETLGRFPGNGKAQRVRRSR